MADLIQKLTSDGQSFGFFQAVTLLEEYFREKDKDGSPIRSGRIRFSSDQSIAFPQSDIASVRTERDTVRFFLTFLGLLGVSSPLPNYFSDYIARFGEESKPLEDFCSLFNNRLYALFYEAFRKYRFPLAAMTAPFLFKLGCLAGTCTQNEVDAYRMLAYTGVLSTRRRSARGLETLVSNYFGDIPVAVTQWVARWAPVSNPTRLGSGAALGVNATVGTEMFDLSGKFRVSLGPLKRHIFERFLEGSPNVATLKKIVAAYATDPLEFDIEVKLAASDLIPVVLGEESARLGQTSSLGTCADAAGEAYSVIVAG